MHTYRNLYICLLLLILLSFSGIVKGQLAANFSANPTSGCEPLIVTFSDLSSGNPTSWFWTFGNGNTSTLKNPSAVYSTAGVYTVKLIITNGVATDSIYRTDYINVFASPNPSFTTNVITGCPPLAIQFNDQSSAGSGTITSWSWDFGDGNSSTLQNPTNTYLSSGNYSITLSLTNSNGCTKIKTFPNSIQITDAPVAQFTANTISACSAPLTVNFTNQSSGSGSLTYLWNFGDGQTSTAVNPTHTYNTNGNYTVILTVSNGGSCDGVITKTNYINIVPIKADFSSNTITGCSPLTIDFIDLTVPTPSSWFWDFGDGTTSILQNPSHTYSSTGNFDVILRASAGGNCNDTIAKISYITINPTPMVQFGASGSFSCSIPFNVNFIDNSSGGVSWQWDFGDGNTSNTQNPTHIYNQAGNFSVTLSVTNAFGCSASLIKNNLIQVGPPQIDFSANILAGCVPLTVNFSDLTFSNDPVVSWEWNFGDGQNSFLKNPTHVYNTTGTFTVSLKITTASGCTDSIMKVGYIHIGNRPNPAFIASPTIVCADVGVQFTNQSTNVDSSTQWFWDFGDGGTSIDKDPFYTYNDTGLFTITLTAINNGCVDTTVRSDYIRVLPPIAIFNMVRSCTDPYFIQFIDSSILPTSWSWDFGDGQTSILQNPVHTYLVTGNYSISLTVFNNITGCSHTMSASVIITDPQALFSANPLSGCLPLTVNFSNNSVDGSSYQWDFGDGNISGAVNPLHTYTIPGRYNVRLIITDGNGCSDTLIKTNYITVLGPIVYFAINILPGCTSFMTVDFSDSSSSNAGITSWLWNFGDGQTSNQKNPSHNFAKNGIYTVSLTVTDGDGCAATMTKNNLIDLSIPDPGFLTSDTLVCNGETVFFNNNTIGNANFLWNFGDGTTSTTNSPSHSYFMSGSYDVSLTVTNSFGCDTTLIKTAFINIPSYNAEFGENKLSATCPPLQIIFSDSSTGNIAGWDWDFGDGSIHSVVQNPIHTYLIPGIYTVTLIATNDIGCKDTLVKPDLINILGPSGTFTFSTDMGCSPLYADFTANATNTLNYFWDFGDGDTGVGNPVSHIYTQLGTFHPILILEDSFGCRIPYNSPDSIVVHHYSTSIDAGPDQSICIGGSAQLNAIANGQINWTPSATLDNDTIANPFATPNQTAQYFLIVIDTNGCASIDSVMVNVLLPPVANAGDDQLIYYGEIANLNGSISSDAISFSWNPINILSGQNTLHPSAIITQTTVFYLSATNFVGCTGVDSVIIRIAPPPIVDVPTAFTPNGDQVNDIIYVRGQSIVEVDFKIFNRWGQLVFETKDLSVGWDGRFKGQPQNMEVYIYYLYALGLKGETFEKKGNITLLR